MPCARSRRAYLPSAGVPDMRIRPPGPRVTQDGRASRMKFWLAIMNLECMIAPEEPSHAGLILIELGEMGHVG